MTRVFRILSKQKIDTGNGLRRSIPFRLFEQDQRDDFSLHPYFLFDSSIRPFFIAFEKSRDLIRTTINNVCAS